MNEYEVARWRARCEAEDALGSGIHAIIDALQRESGQEDAYRDHDAEDVLWKALRKATDHLPMGHGAVGEWPT